MIRALRAYYGSVTCFNPLKQFVGNSRFVGWELKGLNGEL